MLKVLKASAGSGKTYNLAREYIRLVVGNPRADAYRHVLAVTFTNKATEEMKRRILEELFVLATDPGASPYLADFVPSVQPSAQALQQKAQQQLSGILHDYSAFSVSTIDRFFQQTLRAFSREVGQLAGYQVQLDHAALLDESVDSVLDSLGTEDRELLDWLTQGVREDLRREGKFSLEGRLHEMAESLLSLPPGAPPFRREQLLRLRSLCTKVEADYRSRVQSAAQGVLDVLRQMDIAPEQSNRGFLKALYAYQDPDPASVLAPPSASFREKAADPQLWFARSKDQFRLRAQGVLDQPLQDFLDCFGTPYKEYVTARVLRGQIYSLGVAGELKNAWLRIQKEKNLLSIEDSNTLLRDLIDGTDAPFIYEKLGVRYDHFLLDEFQDTSLVQWENFRPLLHNGLAGGNDSLVVGDVKQSIYRWRGSDWTLLGSRLEQEFGQKEVTRLDGNYRTCREIVAFNNAFFPFAAAQLDQLSGTPPQAPDSVSSLYADVAQKACVQDPAPGSVEVCFTQDQPEEILGTLAQVRERGGAWSDIAILVRGNAEAASIAALLVREGIPVVSDDALYVKSSVTVRRLVSRLALVETPPEEGHPTAATYMAGNQAASAPSAYHSLPDLAESLLREIRDADPAVFQAEIPYVQSFMDYLQEWTGLSGNNLGSFLQAWEEASPRIASPQAGDSVRVMTIHKSKGLEFPFVIFPYADKVTLYKAGPHWCAPAVQGTSLEEDAAGVYRISLDSGATQTLFEADYVQERRLQAVDAINVFYVALTRARYGLKIIAAPPAASSRTIWNFGQLLYAYVGQEQFSVGEPYPLGSLRRDSAEAPALAPGYPSWPAEEGSRLRFSPEAADYFGQDGSFGPEASRRIRGNVLHGILSRVRVPEDLPAAVEAAVRSGELPSEMRAETLALLEQRIASVRERGWFAPEARVLREAAILAPDGLEYRPDRVVLHPDGHVDVVDYKFGAPKEAYARQVGRYRQLYLGMGCKKVDAYLWYLEDNFINFVAGN